jgi:HEAT repeat protein
VEKEGFMREAIDRAIGASEVEALVEVLEGARPAEVRYAIERIVEAGSRDGSLLDRARRLADRPEPAARHVACALLTTGYGSDPVGSLLLLRRLADDADWTVRDSAGEACGALLEKGFPRMVETLREWSGAPAANVRRAVVIAVAKAAASRRLEWAEPLLKLVEPLLADRDPTLRRTLGALVLGGALLVYYPDATFEYLAKWSTSTDEQVLWNVAMAFSGPGGPPLAKKALIVLRKLSLDERRYVWRAVASAMWKLGRKKPEVVRPELAQWLEDERRVEVAREALKHL